MYADLEYFLTCSKMFCEDLDAVTYSVPETCTIEVGSKIKETGKKVIFTFMYSGTNNVKTY